MRARCVDSVSTLGDVKLEMICCCFGSDFAHFKAELRLCVCVRACVCACVSACVRACVRACVCACECVCARACVRAYVRVCCEVIIVKLGTVVASDMRMQNVLIILTLTFIQGQSH